MSQGTMERERGDDRHRDVSIERLNEMFNQPSAPEPDRTDAVDVDEARIGEFAPVEIGRRNSPHPSQLGRIGLRHAPFRRPQVEIYTGP